MNPVKWSQIWQTEPMSCSNDCAATESYTIPLLESSYGNIPSCSWPNYSSDVVKWSMRGDQRRWMAATLSYLAGIKSDRTLALSKNHNVILVVQSKHHTIPCRHSAELHSICKRHSEGSSPTDTDRTHIHRPESSGSTLQTLSPATTRSQAVARIADRTALQQNIY